MIRKFVELLAFASLSRYRPVNRRVVNCSPVDQLPINDALSNKESYRRVLLRFDSDMKYFIQIKNSNAGK